MKEYELLHKYRGKSQIEGPFEVVSMALYQKRTYMLNVANSRNTCNELFDYIEILNRYETLRMQFGDIDFDDKHFFVGDSEFQTLDEVERAIKNKAFL